MFFVFAIIIVPLAYYYTARRLIEPAGLTGWKKVLAWIAAVILLFLMFFSRYFWGRYQSHPFAHYYLTGAYSIFGIFGLLFSLILIRDLIFLFARSAKRIITFFISRPDAGPHTPPDLDRRRFLTHTGNMGLLAISGGLAGYGVYEAVRSPDVKLVHAPIRALPDDLEGLSIVQITDLHVGPTVKRDYVEETMVKIMNLKPDMIVFTGDIVEGAPEVIAKDVAPLNDLSAPMGKFFVTGNHEYYHGFNQWLPEIERMGFDVLMNQHRVIKRSAARVIVAGSPDPRSESFDPNRTPDYAAAIRGAPEADVKIMLAHRPHAIFETARLGFDLQLSGHTHGGQVFPGHFLIRLREPFISGLHQVDSTLIYVSRGTGYWGPPMRVGAPGEITNIKLVKAG